MHVYMYPHVCVYVKNCMINQNVHNVCNTHACMYMYVCVCVICTYMYVCMYACVLFVHMYIHVHVHSCPFWCIQTRMILRRRGHNLHLMVYIHVHACNIHVNRFHYVWSIISTILVQVSTVLHVLHSCIRNIGWFYV